MGRLPILSGEELIQLLIKQGFRKIRQKGSHVSLVKKTENREFHTVVPLHDELAKGTLLSILKQCNLTRELFEKILH